MALYEFFVRPHHQAWEIDAGNGYRMGFSSKEMAVREAVDAAQRLRPRAGSVAVFLVERGRPPVKVWPEAATQMAASPNRSNAGDDAGAVTSA